jgi:hypothetical protein
MSKWPLLSRNKIDDSKISEPVQRCTESESENLKVAAQRVSLRFLDHPSLSDLFLQLLDAWSLLETAYRIPKRLKDSEASHMPTLYTPADLFGSADNVRPAKKTRREFDDAPVLDIKPLGYSAAPAPAPTYAPAPEHAPMAEPAVNRPSRAQTASVIAAALAAQQVEAAAAADRVEEEKRKAEVKAERDRKRRERREREKNKPKKDKAARSEANKEKRLLKLVGVVVVKVMSKYKAKLAGETFKKHAKEVCFSLFDYAYRC